MNDRIVIIIDFDNYFTEDLNKFTSEKLESEITDLINICLQNFNVINYIQIRMYGGWYSSMNLTKQASVIQQFLANISLFPIIKGKTIIHGGVELISEMYNVPNFIWGHTYKETNGIRPVRIDFTCVDEICSNNRSLCPKFILNKFTKSKNKMCATSGCQHIQKNIFKGIEQKMVDTMISCDIISISDDNNVSGIMIVSDDQDLYPPIALASQNQKYKYINGKEKMILAIKNRQNEPFISEFLKPFNIQITLI